MSKILFLIGMPGAGKTEWGRKIAGAYHLSFVDIDCYIETQQKKTITEIFEAFGENTFRKIETKALQEIVSEGKPPFIVSCGGGTPLSHVNLSFMKKHGAVIYLKATISTIAKNIAKQSGKRPLLPNDKHNFKKRLTELFEKRKHIYEQADYILDVENLTVEDFDYIIAGGQKDVLNFD